MIRPMLVLIMGYMVWKYLKAQSNGSNGTNGSDGSNNRDIYLDRLKEIREQLRRGKFYPGMYQQSRDLRREILNRYHDRRFSSVKGESLQQTIFYREIESISDEIRRLILENNRRYGYNIYSEIPDSNGPSPSDHWYENIKPHEKWY